MSCGSYMFQPASVWTYCSVNMCTLRQDSFLTYEQSEFAWRLSRSCLGSRCSQKGRLFHIQKFSVHLNSRQDHTKAEGVHLTLYCGYLLHIRTWIIVIHFRLLFPSPFFRLRWNNRKIVRGHLVLYSKRRSRRSTDHVQFQGSLSLVAGNYYRHSYQFVVSNSHFFADPLHSSPRCFQKWG